jgi:hypothetical protein
VRYTDDRFLQAQRARDLGGGRQKGNDPHQLIR